MLLKLVVGEGGGGGVVGGGGGGVFRAFSAVVFRASNKKTN